MDSRYGGHSASEGDGMLLPLHGQIGDRAGTGCGCRRHFLAPVAEGGMPDQGLSRWKSGPTLWRLGQGAGRGREVRGNGGTERG